MPIAFPKHITLIFCLCILSSFPTQQIAAQILEEDTINYEKRHQAIQLTTDRYGMAWETIDTSVSLFHRYQPALQGEFRSIVLGNTGQAAYPILFQTPQQMGFRLGFRQYQQEWYKETDVPYVKTPYPYAQIKYVIGPAEEQLFEGIFAQSITPQLSYAAQYRRIIGQSSYDRQRSTHHNLMASMWYTHPQKQYNVLTSYVLNNANVNQNGGIADIFELQLVEADSLALVEKVLFIDTNITRKDIVGINLANANTRHKRRTFSIQQTFDIGKKTVDSSFFRIDSSLLIKKDTAKIDTSLQKAKKNIKQAPTKKPSKPPKPRINFEPKLRFGHLFRYAHEAYIYEDTDASTDFYNSFFADTTNINIRPALYYTTLQQNTVSNELFVALLGNNKSKKQRTYTGRIGFRYDWNWVEYPFAIDTIATRTVADFTQIDTLAIRRDTTRSFHTGILQFHLANAAQKNNKFNYRLRAEYALFGFNIADFELEGLLTYQFSNRLGGLQGHALVKRLEPDFIQNQWFGHHQQWQNDFSKTNSITLSATYFNPAFKFSFSYRNHSLQNYIIWNAETQPEQLSEVMNISQFILKKDFHFGAFRFRNMLVYQVITPDVIRRPSFASEHLLYYENYLFNKALFTQIGLEVRYQTNFFANAYTPVTGQFFLQNEEQLRFYPVIDVFANFKINRVQLFVKMRHVNQGFLFSQTGYYAAPNYPMPDRAFNFGVRWRFYD